MYLYMLSVGVYLFVIVSSIIFLNVERRNVKIPSFGHDFYVYCKDKKDLMVPRKKSAFGSRKSC